MVLWIEYRHGEVIPKELYYDGWQTYKDDYFEYTPLMTWIENRRGEDIP